ncbi:MAG: cobaltochelatase subunit CobN [Deltaproteobacteria bacterium]|jgi:cobaltochelatase CobN|nr:cobaltochelatase subunit CobN [Deltaproteobacteria bacterium]
MVQSKKKQSPGQSLKNTKEELLVPTLAYYSATGMESSTLSQALFKFLEEGHKFKVIAKTQAQLFDKARREAFIKEALQANVLIIALHGGSDSFAACKEFEKAFSDISSSPRPKVHIQPSSTDVDGVDWAKKYTDKFGSDEYRTFYSYLLEGGSDNFYNLLRLIYNEYTGAKLKVAAPVSQPFDGIYHPDFSGFPSLEEYLAKKIDPNKPTVGLWFHQIYRLNGNLAHFDALIRAVEKKGANILPIFHMRLQDKDLGNSGVVKVAEKYFKDQNGASRIDALLSSMSFSMTLSVPDSNEIFSELNVPVLQATVSYTPRAVWEGSMQGLSTMEVSMSAAQPEFDGNLIAVPFAFREQEKIDPLTKSLMVSYEPDLERTAKLASMAVNWARLAKTPNQDRRVAIIFHHYPPRNDRIGCAAGLDSFRSVVNILEDLKARGYKVEHTYPGEDELAKEMLSKMTCDKRWLTPDQMSKRATARADKSLYLPWHEELPEKVRLKMLKDWGPLPGELFTYGGEMLFAGLATGNIFISIQPPRGLLEKIEELYHDFYIPPPHHYHAQYRWLRDVWKAQAFIHVGKHGSLEWLPGKALGLSEECHPDLAIMDLPNIYPYIINDPGEGTQAKRRSYACIVDHLTPAYTNSDLYDEIAKTDALVAELRLAELEDPQKVPVLKGLIIEAALAADLDKDLKMDSKEMEADFEGFLEKLHSYLHEISDTMIGDGLHVLGEAPEANRLVEFLVQLTRIEGPGAPSLRESLLSASGYDYDELLANSGKPMAQWGGKTGAEIIKENHALSLKITEALLEENFNPNSIAPLLDGFLHDKKGRNDPRLIRSLEYICKFLVPNIRQCKLEISSTNNALEGGFVAPGPSGAPTRGQAEILPTGRNFYSVDPYKIPSTAAWKVGVALGDALLERALKETGKYPENVGILVYGTTTMRTRGDDIAEIYYLLGLKPVWLEGGYVAGLEVIPLKELGRPRIDVTPRISGFFRDSFPNIVETLDTAVDMAARLNEPYESNFLRAHVYEDLEYYKAQGYGQEDAWREATFRVFGCPPGTYGAGVAELVESKKWEKKEDLGEIYIHFSGHAYGRDSYGLARQGNFRRNLARMEVTVKNEDSREYDMMSCTDYYNYYGGLIAAAHTVRGIAPLSLMGDGADPKRVKVRGTDEEAKHILRARLVNPKWLEGLKRHGYKGAGDISHMVDVMFGWDATADVMEDWMYQKVAQTYALDGAMKEWMEKVNPYARQNILDRLLEAIARGMWNADEAMRQRLQDEYLEIEGRLEEYNDQPERDMAV